MDLRVTCPWRYFDSSSVKASSALVSSPRLWFSSDPVVTKLCSRRTERPEKTDVSRKQRKSRRKKKPKARAREGGALKSADGSRDGAAGAC